MNTNQMNANQIDTESFNQEDWDMCMSILLNPKFVIDTKVDKIIDNYFNKFDDDFEMMNDTEFNEFLNDVIENDQMEDINDIFNKYLN
jgi:hypothetical protein